MFMNRRKKLKIDIDVAKHVRVVDYACFNEGYILSVKDYDTTVIIIIGNIEGYPLEYRFIIYNKYEEMYVLDSDSREHKLALVRYSSLL